MSKKWSRNQKLMLSGFIVPVVLAALLTMFVPEIRKKLGLEKKQVSSAPISTEAHASIPPAQQPDTKPKDTKPKIAQSTKPKVSGKNNVAGNNVVGNGNALGNGNQVMSPTVVIPGSGNGISIGQQGGITAGTVVVGPRPAHVTWEGVERDDLPKSEHPRAYAKIFTDQSVPDAKFAVVCDRPCKAAWNSSVAGNNFVKQLFISDHPEIGGFNVVQPNPFPSYTEYFLGVESQDELPVKVLHVGLLNLTEEQKQSLLK